MDITLHAVEQGTGFPLILLHGNGESLQYFHNQIPYFASRYRVIAIDTRGQGESPRGTAPFTIDQFAEDLKAFLDRKGIRKAHILGFSDGGNIALTFALKYNNYVEKLILNGANLSPAGVKPAVQLPICAGYGIISVCARFSERMISKKELLGLMVRQPHIPFERLGEVTAQTLVLVGDRDMIRDSHSQRIADGLKHGTICRIKGSHFIASENPGEFNRVVALFLEDKDREEMR